MVRWEPDARGRLQQAALALYGERGYDATTLAEIAERAGLTKRTSFRHFADAVAAGLDAAGALFEDRHAFAAQRQQIIAAHPELQERELIKLSTLAGAGAVAEALRGRGVGDPAAILGA